MRALKDLSKLEVLAYKMQDFQDKIAELKQVRNSINELIERENLLVLQMNKYLLNDCYNFTTLIDNLNLSSVKGGVTLEFIAQFICDYTGFKNEDVFGGSRKHELVYCRYAFIYLGRIYTDSTFQKIGNFMCRDHTTVVAGLRTAGDLLFTKQSPLLIDIIETFEKQYSRYKNVYNTNNAGDNHAGGTNLSC